MNARPSARAGAQERCVVLDPIPASAPRARRELRELLDAGPAGARLEDGELALAELISNALLHGRGPLRLRLRLDETAVRVEVHDRSPVSPLFSVLDTTAVTGRGLLLVSAVSDRWGVDPDGEGKTVWFELDLRPSSAAPDLDVEALLAAWGDELTVDPAAEDVRVVLTDLDTELVAQAEAHVEGLLRELMLVAANEPAGFTHGRTVRVVLSAAGALAAIRADLRRQVSLALTAGQRRLDVHLTLERRSGEHVRDLLHALQDADRLSRVGELLTEPVPPELTAVRESYLRRLLAQLTW